MLDRYKQFLIEFDKVLSEYYSSQKDYICCKKGCTECCEIGDYPFSRLEAEYIMQGYTKLSVNLQKHVKQNIKNLINAKQTSSYRCPFLINSECSLYDYRGIVCRTFGFAYVDDGIIKLPECVNSGLNYSRVYDKNKKEVLLTNPIRDNLRIDSILRSPLAEKYELECGEIRPLIKWFL